MHKNAFLTRLQTEKHTDEVDPLPTERRGNRWVLHKQHKHQEQRVKELGSLTWWNSEEWRLLMSIAPVMQNSRRQTALKGAVTAAGPWLDPLLARVGTRVFTGNKVKSAWSTTQQTCLLLLCWQSVVRQQMAPDVQAGRRPGRYQFNQI